MLARFFAIFLLIIVALVAGMPQIGGQVGTPVGGVGANTGLGGGQVGGAGLGSNVGGVPANAGLGVGR